MQPLQREIRLVDGFVDLVRERVVRAGRTAPLSTRETQLLAYLADRAGEVVGRDELLTRVWEYRASRPTRAVDLAMTRLRRKIEADPGAPIHLLSVYGEGYRFVAAPAEAVPVVPEPRSTPAVDRPADGFVGRAPVLAALAAALSEARLVTLVGPGGVGKTRLAREHAAARDEPAWFCDLSAARDLPGVVQAVAAALAVPMTGDPAALVSRLGHALAARGPCLLVLDNLEQVVEAAARAAGTWLSLASEARLLATSRQPLKVRGEHVLEVEPLAEDDALLLLRERAAAAGADWEGEDAVLREVVRRLDGLPLALELAAGRARTLSPARLRDRLEERFRLLRGDRRDRSDRHETLRAALDWSWDLLSEEERRTLAWLSTFRGGFTVEAVEEVCDVGGTWPLDTLAALRDRSLVAARGERFLLLETVQAYARLKLADREVVVERHARYYASEGERLVQALWGPASVERLAELDLERANLLAAHRRTCSPVLRARLALVLFELVRLRGPLDAMQPILAEALAGGDAVPAELRARLLASSASLHDLSHQPAEAIAAAEQAIATAPEEALSARAEGHFRLGDALYWFERYEEAVEHERAAVRLFHQDGNRYKEACALGSSAESLRGLGRYDEARDAAQRASDLFRSLGDDRGLGVTLAILARIHLHDRRVDEAAALLDEAIGHMRAVEDHARLATMLAYYASPLAQATGDLERAAGCLAEAAELYERLGNLSHVAVVRLSQGNAVLECGRVEEARGHFGDARRLVAAGASTEVYGRGPVLLPMLDVLEGIALLDLGQAAASRSSLRRGLDGCRRDGTDLSRGWAGFNVGLGLLADDPARGREALEDAVSCAERQEDGESVHALRAILAVALARDGVAWEETLRSAGEGLGLVPLARAVVERRPLPDVTVVPPYRGLTLDGADLHRAERLLRRLPGPGRA